MEMKPLPLSLRVSGKGQVKGHGFDRQRDTISDYAKRNRCEVSQWFQEAHTGTEADRPVFAEMLAEILANGVRTIVVESMDRFSRGVVVQSALLAQLIASGITLISASTGEDITASLSDDPMREGMVLMQGVFAQIEKKRLVLKLRKAREAKRKEHGRCEGDKPFGMKAGEAVVLARMQELAKPPKSYAGRSGGQGLPLQSIADELNAEGHRNRRGGLWTKAHVWHVLNSAKQPA